MPFKTIIRVLWLALQPLDTLQKPIGALGMIFSLLISLGFISVSSCLAWLYYPTTNPHDHNWLGVSLVVVSTTLLCVLLAVYKLQHEKDELDNVKFTVKSEVLNHGAILEVTNNAKTAKFRATGRVMQDIHHQPELYKLFWEEYGGEAELGNGDTANILVARQGFINKDYTVIGLLMFKATTHGEDYFFCGTQGIDGRKADPVYIEVTVKPLSSSKKDYKAYYVLEQPTITQLVFREIDSLPKEETVQSGI